MTIREETQAIERQTLSRYATLSQSTRGRRRPEVLQMQVGEIVGGHRVRPPLIK